jgi:hypothetical protein
LRRSCRSSSCSSEAAGDALGIHKSTSKRYDDESIEIPLSIELAIEALEARWQRVSRKRR